LISGLCEALLDSVKVTIPDQGTIPLNAVASVTVKQSTLFVEVWDTDVSPSLVLESYPDKKASKHVESAIHKANLPGITPQKMGANTLKIPVPR
jgi:ribosome recycling factor